jgi:hypothetical protein
MGKSLNKFEIILSEEDYHACNMREEIMLLLEKKEFCKAKEYIHTYKETTDCNISIHKQFVLRSEASLIDRSDDAMINRKRILIEAISCTIINFNINKISHYYLSYTELNIIVDIAYYMIAIEDNKTAKSILEQIMHYIEKHYKNEVTNEIYPRIAISLIKLLFEEKKYDKALDICTKGLDAIVNSLTLDYRGELLYLKASLMENIIKTNNNRWLNNKDDIIDIYFQSYYIFDFLEDNSFAYNIKKHISKEYSWANID